MRHILEKCTKKLHMTAEEFNKCVDLYADNLYRFILKNIKDEEKARDVVQDTYEKLWLKVSEVESTNAKSYMFTTAYRTMIDRIRRDKKQGERQKLLALADKVLDRIKEVGGYDKLTGKEKKLLEKASRLLGQKKDD